MNVEEDYEAPPPLGLFPIKEKEILPLFSTEIKANIFGKFAKVILVHNYYNPYEEYLDTSFKFPKGLYQVFDGIEAEIEGRTIKGLVGLKQNIRKKYVEDLSKGSTVVKTEDIYTSSTKIQNDILVTEIGNIPPHKEIKIIFSFLQTLDISFNKTLKFVLPLVLNPRYIPLGKTYDLLKNYIYKGNLNVEEFLNMAKVGNIKYIQNENENNLQYYYNINVNVISMIKIDKIETKMKNNKVIIKKINDNEYNVSLDPSEFHIPNEDFVLEYEINEEILKMPSLLLESHPKYKDDYCLYYSFNPTKQIKDINDIILEDPLNEDFQGNFLFLVDRSGSMYGNRLDIAKKSLIYFLKSLQNNRSKFNIICFGSIHYSIFRENEFVNEENIQKALKLVMQFEANLGRNEIKKALDYIKNKNLIDTNLINRVFIMTDGESFDIDDCLDILRDISHNPNFDCKFYSLGIGNGCSENLIRGIAKCGDGDCEFVKNEEDVTDKVNNLLKSSMNYCLNNFNFKLKKYNDNIIKQCEYSNKLNTNIEFFALLNNPELLKDNSIICSFSFKNKKYNYEKTIELNKAFTSDTLHKLFLKQYFDSNYYSTELAIKYQILTKDTAFYCLFQENNLSDEEILNKKYKEIENIPPIELERLGQFYAKTLTGKTTTLDYISSYTIEQIKIQIQDKEGFNPNEQLLFFGKNQLEDNKTLNDYNIRKGDTIILVLRLKGEGGSPPNPLNYIKIVFNNEEIFSYRFKGVMQTMNENIGEMLKNVLLKLDINGKIEDYDFYNEENYLNNKIKETIYDIFYYNLYSNRTLKIFSKKEFNLSQLDNIIINQKMNGLWKNDNFNLSWFNFDKKKWKEFLMINKTKIKEIFKKSIKEEAIFNLIVLSYIISVSSEKIRSNLIFKKAIKGLHDKYPSINEEKVYWFKDNIKLNS